MKAFILSACLLACLLLGGVAPAFAQLASDPNDRLYTDLEIWSDRGLTGDLPPFRPYPVLLLKKVLADVAARGTDADRALAAWYLSKIDGGSNLHAVASSVAATDMKGGYGELGFEGTLQGSLTSFISYSAKSGAIDIGPGAPLLPEYQRSLINYVYDGANGPGFLGLTPRMSFSGAAAIGTDSVYLQTGMLRSSYGPFWGDNVILSPTAPQSGQFAFVYNGGGVAVTLLFMMISPTTNTGSGRTTSGKYATLGGLELHPFDWLSLGVFNTVVWGERFEPLYLLPVISFYTQGLAAYSDNSFIGLSGEIKLPGPVKMDLVAYIDDLGTQWLHLDFNFMLLAAFQAGVTWTPNLPYLTRLRVTNVLVTPYMYSHQSYKDTDPVNWLNYTNQGQNMGPSIEPNSDRLEIQALVRPTTWLDLSPFTRFILHGNASTGLTNLNTPNDGSVFDDGIQSNGYYSYSPTPPQPGLIYTRLLSQSVLEKVFQVGFDATATLPTAVGEMRATVSYTFELVFDGSIRGQGPVAGNNSINNYLGLGVSFTY